MPVKTSASFASALSKQLREETSRFLSNRRGILISSLLGGACMGLISLYQMGIIEHLPDPPLRGFNAEKVDASPQAYQWLATPDGALGMASYAITGALAAMDHPDRAIDRPLVPLVLAAKAGGDAIAAAKLTLDQVTRHKAFCRPCLVAAGASFVSAVLSIPEARAALEQLRK